MKKVILLPLPENIFSDVGKLILLFSHVEWLIANVLLLGKINSVDYAQTKQLSITQDYFETLLSIPFSRKLEKLEALGFDIVKLRSVGKYRDTIAHGIIFKNQDGFTVKKASVPEKPGVVFHEQELTKTKEVLEEEGGKLLTFIESRGYKHYEPKD